MSQQIKNDLKKKLAFNCEFDELVTDNIENQICLHILKKCYTYLKDDDLRRKCNTLIRRFSIEVTEELEDGRKHLIESDFKIVYNRLNEHYKPIHELAKIIWQGIGISDLYKFSKSSINSLFIPMHQVFEKFLENLFTKYFPEFEVDTQTTKQAWKKQEEIERGIDCPLSARRPLFIENIRSDVSACVEGVGGSKHEMRAIEHVCNVVCPDRGRMEQVARKHFVGEPAYHGNNQPAENLPRPLTHCPVDESYRGYQRLWGGLCCVHRFEVRGRKRIRAGWS